MQYLTGVYHTELSHQPDEAAHVVTSLMIHDYLQMGVGTGPLKFAKNYYVEYPKVAIGIWPPLFHTTAALWMLIFTRTPVSLLIFVAFQTTACAATLVLFARRLFPPWVAFALGLFMILLPAFQTATSTVMVDVFVAMMELWVMLLMIALFRTGSMKVAIGFGVLTGLAMLTKGNANSIVLSGIFMLLLTRQFSILKRSPIYVAGAIVILLGGPWQFLMLHSFQVRGNPLENVSMARFGAMVSAYTKILIERLSLPVFLFAVVGVAAGCLTNRRDSKSLDIRGALAMLAGGFLFHSMAPIGLDDRYMIPILPLLLIFAALGIQWLAVVLPVPRLSLEMKTAVLAVFCLGWFAKATWSVTHRPEIGFDQIAMQLLPAPRTDETVLVCSDSLGEGAFITSLAFKDRRGSEHLVLRGSKVLSKNAWVRGPYRPFFQNPTELESYLEQMPVDAIAVDLSQALWEQDRALLMEAIRSHPDKWALVSEIQEDSDKRHLQLFRWLGSDQPELRKTARVRIEAALEHDLGF